MSVSRSRLRNGTHSCGPIAPACSEQVLCFRTQTQNLDLQGGQLLNLGLAVFPLGSGAPSGEIGAFETLPAPKKSCQHLPFAGKKDKERI